MSHETEEIIILGGDLTWRDVKSGIRGYCDGTAWRNRLPFTRWLPKYSVGDFVGDMVAGITVGLTVIPQALAFVVIADLPMEMGLYSGIMGCFIYAMFGSAKDITLGPTSVMSLLTAAMYPANATMEDRANCAVLLAFYFGVVSLLLGIFNLGFLVNFISEPVISAFTTASAFIIFYGQLKGIFGVTFPSSDSVFDWTVEYVKQLKNISGWDTLLGIVCISVLLVLKELTFPKDPKWGITKRTWRIFAEGFRIFKAVRYGFVVLLCTILGYYSTISGFNDKIALTNNVKSGLPVFVAPRFTWANYTFTDTLSMVGPSLPFLVLVGGLDAIALAKAFSSQFHYTIVPSQELIALGLANIVGSFFRAYPITASFSRSSLFSQSGVRTQMGSVWTGGFVLMAVAVIAEAFKYIPKATLSSVIIVAVLMLFNFKIFKKLWLCSKRELIPMFVTIIVSFTVGVDYGLLAGTGTSLLMLLYPTARPFITTKFSRYSPVVSKEIDPLSGRSRTCISITPEGALFFPATESLADFFQQKIIDADNNGGTVEIVFDGTHLEQSDYTTLHALGNIALLCEKTGKKLKFTNTSRTVLQMILTEEMLKQLEWEELGSMDKKVSIFIPPADASESPIASTELEKKIPRQETTTTLISDDGAKESKTDH